MTGSDALARFLVAFKRFSIIYSQYKITFNKNQCLASESYVPLIKKSDSINFEKIFEKCIHYILI